MENVQRDESIKFNKWQPTNGEVDVLPKTKKVLVLEDDQFSRKMFKKIVTDRDANYEVVFANSYEEGVQEFSRAEGIKLVIIDVVLDGQKNGLDFYHYLQSLSHRPAIILTSARPKESYTSELKKGEQLPPFLSKPFHPKTCAALIEEVLTSHEKQ